MEMSGEQHRVPRPDADERPIGYLELLHRGGRVVQRLPVRQRRIDVGRAYDNDLIIDDPYVCAHHLSLQWNGERLEVIDRGSINRPVIEARQGAGPLSLACGEQLRLGRSILRFRSASFPVAPTRVDESGNPLFGFFARPTVQVVSLLLLVALLLVERYFDTVVAFELQKAVPKVATALLMVAVWGMLWAFVSRMLLHRWHFWAHCSIITAGLLLLELTGELVGTVSFAFGLGGSASILESGLEFLVISAVLFFSLHFATMASPGRLLKGALGATTVLLGLFLLLEIDDLGDFSSRPDYSGDIRPPAFKLVASKGVDDFFADSNGMVAAIEEEVAEADEEKAKE